MTTTKATAILAAPTIYGKGISDDEYHERAEYKKNPKRCKNPLCDPGGHGDRTKLSFDSRHQAYCERCRKSLGKPWIPSPTPGMTTGTGTGRNDKKRREEGLRKARIKSAEARAAGRVYLTNLRLYKEEHNLSFPELAKVAGIGQSSLSDFDKGKRHPKEKQARYIARNLGVSYEWLTGE